MTGTGCDHIVAGKGAEKRHAPATLRNREAIADVLARELPESGVVLEIASGSGEHAVYFADRFPKLEWQPSDVERDALASIIAYRDEYSGSNLRFPTVLDASAPEKWEVKRCDAIVCINMLHISPWSAAEGLFAGCGEKLGNPHNPAAPLILYGPFFDGVSIPAQSNMDFDASLKARNPLWGIRRIEHLDELAAEQGLSRCANYAMPANNQMLVYRC